MAWSATGTIPCLFAMMWWCWAALGSAAEAGDALSPWLGLCNGARCCIISCGAVMCCTGRHVGIPTLRRQFGGSFLKSASEADNIKFLMDILKQLKR